MQTEIEDNQNLAKSNASKVRSLDIEWQLWAVYINAVNGILEVEHQGCLNREAAGFLFNILLNISKNE